MTHFIWKWLCLLAVIESVCNYRSLQKLQSPSPVKPAFNAVLASFPSVIKIL